jgi:hypothetical protein
MNKARRLERLTGSWIVAILVEPMKLERKPEIEL